jgi:hypothetical protein
MNKRVTIALGMLAQMVADEATDDLVMGYLWALQDLGVHIERADEAHAILALLEAGLMEVSK